MENKGTKKAINQKGEVLTDLPKYLLLAIDLPDLFVHYEVEKEFVPISILNKSEIIVRNY